MLLVETMRAGSWFSWGVKVDFFLAFAAFGKSKNEDGRLNLDTMTMLWVL
jgi:hypothetical protein